MTQHDPVVTLRQLIDFCEASQLVLGDRDAAAVEADLVTALALTRALELVGEAANRLPPEFRDVHPQVPWRTIINFRNVLAHGYDVIDYTVAVGIVRNDLPPLVEQLQAILDSESSRGG